VVTTKLGNWAVNKAKSSLAKVSTAVAAVLPASVPLQKRKIYKTELLIACLFLMAAFFAIFIHAKWMYAVFCLLQGITFLGFGLSCFVDGHKRTACCY
jgi:fatty acid desaturase